MEIVRRIRFKITGLYRVMPQSFAKFYSTVKFYEGNL